MMRIIALVAFLLTNINNIHAIRIPKLFKPKTGISDEEMTKISNDIKQVLIEVIETYDVYHSIETDNQLQSNEKCKTNGHFKQNLLSFIKNIIQTRKVQNVVTFYKRYDHLLNDELRRHVWDALVEITSPIVSSDTESVVLKSVSDFAKNVSIHSAC